MDFPNEIPNREIHREIHMRKFIGKNFLSGSLTAMDCNRMQSIAVRKFRNYGFS